MSFLSDTDICSAHLKGDRQVWHKMLQHGGQLHVSAVSVGELFTWALRTGVSPKRRQALLDFLQDVTVLDVTATVGERVSVDFEPGWMDAGQGTPDMDLLIAATALVHDLTLVTHNVQDYSNVPGLRIQDWLSP